jgi:WD40 repeat protein
LQFTQLLDEIRFSPNRTANPFNLFVLTDSGTLSHFDLRQEKSCLARRVAHASTGVGLDWLCDDYNSLLASAGADGIVKIWNLNELILPSTAMRTITVGRSICGMAWRPGYSAQLVITPSSLMADLEQQGYSDYERGPSSAISSNHSDDLILNKAMNANIGSSVSDVVSESNQVGGGRHSEILLWDIRRQYVPEMIIRGRDGPASGNQYS